MQRKTLTFWGANEDDDSLVKTVIDGSKTVTCDLEEEYNQYENGGYCSGDIVEVWDLQNTLRCIIEITKVHPITFDNIPEEVWQGETFTSAKEFQDVHIKCMPDVPLTRRSVFIAIHFKLLEVVKN